MTLDEIKEQLAVYNRLYYNLRKDDEKYMPKKRHTGLRHAQKKRIKEYVQNHNIHQEDLSERQITETMNDKKPSGRKRGGTIKYDMVSCKIVMPMVHENDDLISYIKPSFFVTYLYGREAEIIHDICFDKAGFGSKSRTLAESREKDKTITMGDINEFFRKNVDPKRKPVGQNSLVAPYSAICFL